MSTRALDVETPNDKPFLKAWRKFTRDTDGLFPPERLMEFFAEAAIAEAMRAGLSIGEAEDRIAGMVVSVYSRHTPVPDVLGEP